MKKGYHSTQRKYFGTIPRSEFYGIGLGYAIGLLISGALRLETQVLQLGLALLGFGIGYFIDWKYFQVKDEPESSIPEEQEETGSEDGNIPAAEGAEIPDEE